MIPSPYQEEFDTWEITEYGSFILHRENFMISYNPSTETSFIKQGYENINELYDLQDTEETAVYIRETGQYLILNGDFRNEYEQCETLQECLEIYNRESPLYRSKWSMD